MTLIPAGTAIKYINKKNRTIIYLLLDVSCPIPIFQCAAGQGCIANDKGIRQLSNKNHIY